MKILFAGTPAIAIPTLEALSVAGHEVVGVVTRPDSPVGRKRIMTESPVATFAQAHGIPVFKTERLTDETLEPLVELKADLGVVVAFGALLSAAALNIPSLGWINLHFSALPEWRGAAPIQWQIMTGSREVGTSVFQLVAELDAGDVFDTRKFTVKRGETTTQLLKRLSVLGADQVVDVISMIANGQAHAVAQQGQATYARKLVTTDGLLNTKVEQSRVFAQFRAVTDEPGAYVVHQGVRIKILEMNDRSTERVVAPETISFFDGRLWLGTQSAPLEIERVQPAGKTAMAAVDWFRGLHLSEVRLDATA